MPLDQQHPREFLPASTYLFSQPLTCLYAMQQHGMLERYLHYPSPRATTTTLTIHIVGASTCFELFPTQVWEEILHCLPAVSVLNVVFVGPEAGWLGSRETTPTLDRPETGNFECCPVCQSHGRLRRFFFYGQTYHDFQRSFNSSSNSNGGDAANPTAAVAPDLIVAFNTGFSEEEVESWNESLAVILDLNVPAMFTSYDLDEADLEYKILASSQCNAKLLTGAPVRNPWRVDVELIDPSGPGDDPFYQVSKYGICFQGRRQAVVKTSGGDEA